jgi:hypothetical protein
MKGFHWGKFFWRDWQTDLNLQACSLAARGLWMEMLCNMAVADPVGHLILPPRRKSETEAKQVGRMCKADARQVLPLIRELESMGVFSRNNEGIIICRRMIRDAERSQEGRIHIAKRWGEPNRSPNRLPNRSNGSHLIGDLLVEAEAEAEAVEGGHPLRPPKKRTPPTSPLGGEALVVANFARKEGKE